MHPLGDEAPLTGLPVCGEGSGLRRWLRVHDTPRIYADLAAIYDVFSRIAIPPSTVWARGDDAVRRSIDGLTPELAHVFATLAGAVLGDVGLNPAHHDVECWSNRLHAVGERVELHVDNDEVVRASTGVVITPRYGSIFYVGGSKAVGGTWFRAPLADVDQDQDLFQRPHFARVKEGGGMAVPFVAGRLVVFDGRMPHCVMPFTSVERPRVALLCNVWPRGTFHARGRASPLGGPT